MNEQEMNLQLRDAIVKAKKRFTESFTVDTGLTPEKQQEKLVEAESTILAEEMTKVFFVWLTDLENRVKS